MCNCTDIVNRPILYLLLICILNILHLMCICIYKIILEYCFLPKIIVLENSQFSCQLSGLKSSNGVFTSWVDGSPLSHTDWAKDEPETHAKERCVTISRKDDFKWVTGLCNFAQPFVCREPGMSKITFVICFAYQFPDVAN